MRVGMKTLVEDLDLGNPQAAGDGSLMVDSTRWARTQAKSMAEAPAPARRMSFHTFVHASGRDHQAGHASDFERRRRCR